jgi:hypothetical protein
MSDYLSGRELNLKIGVSSYTESKVVLEVIGKTILGVTSTTDLYADTLRVRNLNFDGFSFDNLVVSGVVTASKFISTVLTGTSPITVASSTLVSNLNAQYLNGNQSSYYTNASNLNAGLVPAARLFSSNDFNVLGSLYVSNDLSVGGTTVILNAQSLQIKDKDIVLGITTDTFGNDISTDLTANHGGIAIASTVGNPLFSLSLSGISSVPDTYKQMMWVKSGTFAGLNTDAFLFNYAVGVGTNQLQPGVRLKSGALEVTDSRVSSGLFVGALQGNASTATTANNLPGGLKGSIPYQDSPGITTLLSAGPPNYILLSNGPGLAPYWGNAGSASQAFTGITIKDEGATVGITSQISILDFVGPNVRATANPSPTGIATITIVDYVSLAGIATNVIGGIASVTNLNVTGPSTISSVQISGGIVTATNFVGNLSGIAVTARNVIGGVQGSILFQKSSGITTVLPPGLNGQVLITNGDNQDPYWAPLTSATGSFGGITIKDEGNVVGTASSITTVNFTGPNVSVVANSGPNGIATVTIADYVSVSGYSTVSGIATYTPNAGIATNVIGGIASVTNLNVTGPSTIGSVQFSGGIVTATTFSGNLTGSANIGNLNVSGTSTLGNLQVSSGIVTASTGIVTYYGDGSKLQGVSAFSVVSQTLTSNPTYLTFATNAGVSSIGVSTTGSTSFIFIPSSGFVGIGSTTPVSKLDVNGDVRVSGVVTATRFSGDGSQLTGINATSIVGITTYSLVSGIATNVIGGIASVTALNVSGITTVASLNVSGIGTTIPVKIGTGSSIFVIDSMGDVGINTNNPQYPLDVVGNVRVSGNIIASNVISLDANVGEIVRTNAGVVSTNSLNTVVLDTYNTSLYRSARYTVQVSSQGSLIPGTSSISSITGGTYYFPGTYTSQDIVSAAGVGSYGKATINVVPEFSIAVNSCIDGVFTAAANLPTGVTTNQTILFNQNLNLSQRQQSKISSFALSPAGTGYTATPTITVSSPIIASNPVPEVGIGSTAIVTVSSMLVSNVVQTTSGFVTSVIPTVTFSSPSIGVTATGLVSFGISTINVTNAGSGYTFSPSLTIAAPYNPTGFAATVGLGISTLNWAVSGGSGYFTGETPVVTINPIGGIGTGASITGLVGAGGTVTFTFVSPGFGYSTPPAITVSGGTGVGAAVTITRMIVSNVTVTAPGSGVTVGLARTNDITFSGGGGGTGAGATAVTIVSTGVSITNAGFGYSLPPSITYNPAGVTTSQTGLGISALNLLSTGIGYTVIPSVTISPGPSIGITVAAGLSTALGYAGIAGTTILAGPGYGATSVYYMNILSNRTFNISTSIGVGLTAGTGIVGYGFSIGLSTSRTGTLSLGSTTLIAGAISTTGITVGMPVQNNTIIAPGTTVSNIGIGSIFLNTPALNTGLLTTSFIFGTGILIGGRVNSVNAIEIGSGYAADQSITARLPNFDRSSIQYDANVGSGFTFTVSNVVNNFQLSDVFTLHSVGSGSTTAYFIELAGVADTAELGEFGSTLTGTGSTSYNLTFTPNYAYNILKFNKTLFTV